MAPHFKSNLNKQILLLLPTYINISMQIYRLLLYLKLFSFHVKFRFKTTNLSKVVIFLNNDFLFHFRNTSFVTGGSTSIVQDLRTCTASTTIWLRRGTTFRAKPPTSRTATQPHSRATAPTTSWMLSLPKLK